MNPSRNNNARRSNKPRGRQLARTRNGFTQNAAVASHRDSVPQVRKFMIFDQLNFDNATPQFSFGHAAFNITGTSQPFQGLISNYSSIYEQYRVRKIVMRAQVGKGFTNDRRIKTYMATRVDVDNQNTASTLSNVQALLASENTTVKTFTERGNIMLAYWRPIQRSNISNLSEPVLPSTVQWYPTNDVQLHTWKGVNVAAFIPETSLQPEELNITISFEVDVEFRGRITGPGTTFTGNDLVQTPVPTIPLPSAPHPSIPSYATGPSLQHI